MLTFQSGKSIIIGTNQYLKIDSHDGKLSLYTFIDEYFAQELLDYVEKDYVRTKAYAIASRTELAYHFQAEKFYFHCFDKEYICWLSSEELDNLKKEVKMILLRFKLD